MYYFFMKAEKKERKDEILFKLAVAIGMLFALAITLAIVLIVYCAQNVKAIYFPIYFCPFLFCFFLGFYLFF